MNALEVLTNIKNNQILRNAKMKFCLVSPVKLPFRVDGTIARPNHVEDFVDISEIEKCQSLQEYAGLGISIQASNVIAIDVDKCFAKPFDITSANNIALDVIEMFIDHAYMEFSFSGTGLRVFYRQEETSHYSTTYYTKAEKYGIEYYQPSCSYRYVTITGKTIANNDIDSKETFRETIERFLNKYMKRRAIIHRESQIILDDTKSIDELLKDVKKLYLKNIFFQDRWFDTEHLYSNIPGKSRESHNDYQLLALIYENITHDRTKVRLIFEQSPYFKSKDAKHMQKWMLNDYRYFNFQFDQLTAIKEQTHVSN